MIAVGRIYVYAGLRKFEILRTKACRFILSTDLFNVSRIDEYRMERSPVQKIRLLYNSVKTFLLLKRKIHGSFEVKFETENDCKKYEK